MITSKNTGEIHQNFQFALEGMGVESRQAALENFPLLGRPLRNFVDLISTKPAALIERGRVALEQIQMLEVKSGLFVTGNLSTPELVKFASEGERVEAIHDLIDAIPLLGTHLGNLMNRIDGRTKAKIERGHVALEALRQREEHIKKALEKIECK